MQKYRAELERVSEAFDFELEQAYLNTAAGLSRSQTISRIMYPLSSRCSNVARESGGLMNPQARRVNA